MCILSIRRGWVVHLSLNVFPRLELLKPSRFPSKFDFNNLAKKGQ